MRTQDDENVARTSPTQVSLARYRVSCRDMSIGYAAPSGTVYIFTSSMNNNIYFLSPIQSLYLHCTDGRIRFITPAKHLVLAGVMCPAHHPPPCVITTVSQPHRWHSHSTAEKSSTPRGRCGHVRMCLPQRCEGLSSMEKAVRSRCTFMHLVRVGVRVLGRRLQGRDFSSTDAGGSVRTASSLEVRHLGLWAVSYCVLQGR